MASADSPILIRWRTDLAIEPVHAIKQVMRREQECGGDKERLAETLVNPVSILLTTYAALAAEKPDIL